MMLETTPVRGDRIYYSARLALRPMTAGVADGLLVAAWRNSAEARANFFSGAVITPETHAAWMAAKDPYRQIWIVEVAESAQAVGMAGLTIDPADYSAEVGAMYIAPEFRPLRYGQETEYMLLAVAFEFYELRSVWADVYASNKAPVALHISAGYKPAGVDLPGHTAAGGPVLHITYDRVTWAERRADFAALGAQLGEWRP